MAEAPVDESEGRKGTKEMHWVMTEQKKVGLTIQLCHFKEDGCMACSKYYPEKVGEKMVIGMYSLTCLESVFVTNWFSENKELYSMVKVEYKRKYGSTAGGVLEEVFQEHEADDRHPSLLGMAQRRVSGQVDSGARDDRVCRSVQETCHRALLLGGQ